ncbi:MAG: hypothetical protein Q9172_005736 [Xanthocarpia lactea]
MDSLNSAPLRPDVIRQDKGPRLVAVIWVFASLTLLTILSLIYGALLTASVHLGLGKHAFAIDPSKITYAIKLYTIAVPFGIVVLALTTLAIAIVLNGLIAPSKWHTCILYFLPVLQFVIGITGIAMLLTQCTPTSALWNPQPGAKCRDKSISINYLYFKSAYVAFVDVFLAVVPFVAYWKLQIKAKAKIGLFLVMSATVLAAICALVRVAYITSLHDFRDYTCKPCRFDNLRSKMIDSLADTTINHTMWAVPRVYRDNSFARIESTPGAGDEGEILWQQGYGKGKEKEETEGKFDDLEDQRGRTSGMVAGEAVEVDSQDIETDGDDERQMEVQELREILQGRSEARRSWLERVRGMTDKRMTI